MTTSAQVSVGLDPDARPDSAERFLQDVCWSDALYLQLAAATNHLVELRSGHLEVLPLPTLSHQTLVARLFRLLDAWLEPQRLGRIVLAPHPIRLWPGRFREPDLAVYLADSYDRLGEQYSGVPDLVIEVLSPGTRHIDLGEKRNDYAQAGIREYWLVDPEAGSAQCLVLAGDAYAASAYEVGPDRIASVLLPGFTIQLGALFD